MVRVAPKEGEAPGLKILGIDVRNFESQHLSVKSHGAIEVAHHQDDMTEPLNLKRHSLWRRHFSQFLDIQSHILLLSPLLVFLCARHFLPNRLIKVESMISLGGNF